VAATLLPDERGVARPDYPFPCKAELWLDPPAEMVLSLWHGQQEGAALAARGYTRVS